MKLLVCGGRDYGNRGFAFYLLDKMHARKPIAQIIEGGARGADRFGRLWGEANGIEVATYPADWDRYKHTAGRVRNAQMLREGHPDIVAAFRGGSGTANMIRLATAAGVPVFRSWRFEA